MKKFKAKDIFLESLRTVPIVQISATKAGISRKTVYEWRKKDEKFAKEMDEAMVDGIDYVNDMSEGQLLNLIKEKNWPALAFWLKTRNPKFKDKLEVMATIEEKGKLSPEEEKIVRKAISLASFGNNNENKDYGTGK